MVGKYLGKRGHVLWTDKVRCDQYKKILHGFHGHLINCFFWHELEMLLFH